jgi:hypothetical protein
MEAVELGCPVSALGSEMHRQAPEVRHVATRHIKEMIDLVARQLPNWGTPEAHEQAVFMVSSMIGAMVMARAVDDPALSRTLRESALKHLSGTTK